MCRAYCSICQLTCAMPSVVCVNLYLRHAKRSVFQLTCATPIVVFVKLLYVRHSKRNVSQLACDSEV